VRIISRHYLASYLRLFSAILAGSLLSIVIVEMLLNFDDVVENRNAAGIATYFLLRIPSEYLRDALPLASFAAAFLCIGGAARAREVTALKAGGIPPRRIALPVLLASLVLSSASLLASETVILSAERGWNRLSRPGQGIAWRRGSFWYHRGNVVYNILGMDGASHTLHGVSVFRLNAEGRLV
jgi:lipopolysaccharide export LptBFGC system permease protein LptF